MNRIKSLIIKHGKLIVAGSFLVILTLLLFGNGIWNKIPSYTTHVGNNDEEQFIYNIPENYPISQDFSCDRNYDFITLSFSDHDQRIEGKTIISVTDKENGNVVYYEEFNNCDIHYGSFVKVEWPSENKGGHVYNVTIYEIGTGEVAPGIFGYPVDNEIEAAVTDGRRSSYAVSIGMHSYTNVYRQLVFFTVAVMIIMMLVCLWCGCKVRLSEEKLFLCLGIPLGIVYLSFIAVNPVHDGATHLAKVYHYSNVILGKADLDERGSVYLYEKEAELFGDNYSGIYRENELIQQYWEIRSENGRISLNDSMVKSHEYRETSVSSFWEYFPGAIGMTVGRLLRGSAGFNILLAKVFFFIFYIFMCYEAVRIAPVMKTALAFIALLPMSVYQATGITYDSVVIAFVVLILAFWLKAEKCALTKREWICVVVLAYLIGCCKGGFYTVILLLFCLIPRKFTGGKKKLWCSAILISALLAVLTTSLDAYLPYIQNIFYESSPAESESINQNGDKVDAVQTENSMIEMVPEKDQVAYGVMFIVRDPVQSAKIILNSLIENADDYLGSMIGHRMAWSDTLTPWFVVISFLFLIALGTLKIRGHAEREFGLGERIACLILLGSEVIAFHLLMFIETPVGSMTVKGVQGRYFIAWLPVLLTALRPEGVQIEQTSVKKLYVGFSVASMLHFFFFLRNIFGIV